MGHFSIDKDYHTFDIFLKEKFNSKVAKLSLDIGTTCPNRDGTKGKGGCIFCSSFGSGDFCSSGSVYEQLSKQKEIVSKKWNVNKFIPYFQAGTGTYGNLEKLEKSWYEALDFEGVVGTSIATRSDCIDDKVIEKLKRLNQKTFLTVELGLQTIFNASLKYLNRNETFEDFLKAYEKLKNNGISVCVHLIDGIPGETKNMMLETAKTIAKLEPDFVKIHMLHVLKNTFLGNSFLDNPFALLTKEEYTSIVVSQIEMFPKFTVFERVTGDGNGVDLLAPLWTKKKREVLNEIDKEFRLRNSFQGKYFSGD